MARSMWLSAMMLAALVSGARATIEVKIEDRVDDDKLVDAVSGQKPVKEFAAEIEALEQTITANKRDKVEKLLGKPVEKPGKDFALPVAQHRMYSISGIRYADEKKNKNHIEFYSVGDFAVIEVWYAIDGESPQFAVLYFKVDDTFPKLKKIEEKAYEKPAKLEKLAPAVSRKHTIDVDHWDKMKRKMNKEQVAELFSVPAGDYAPGTDYLTRSWGWRRGEGGKSHETLEWRSEKGRIVVEFDEKGDYVFSEFYYPGRDPVTNVAERLKWDRAKFDKLKKYIEERTAEK